MLDSNNEKQTKNAFKFHLNPDSNMNENFSSLETRQTFFFFFLKIDQIKKFNASRVLKTHIRTLNNTFKEF